VCPCAPSFTRAATVAARCAGPADEQRAQSSSPGISSSSSESGPSCAPRSKPPYLRPRAALSAARAETRTKPGPGLRKSPLAEGEGEARGAGRSPRHVVDMVLGLVFIDPAVEVGLAFRARRQIRAASLRRGARGGDARLWGTAETLTV
jgi:hypothetical protein